MSDRQSVNSKNTWGRLEAWGNPQHGNSSVSSGSRNVNNNTNNNNNNNQRKDGNIKIGKHQRGVPVSSQVSATSSRGANRMMRFVARPRMDTEGMTLDQHYQDFVMHTYSSETALLAFNLWTKLTEMGVFNYFLPESVHDTRAVAIQLSFLFYKYQVPSCDIALDWALMLIYLSEMKPEDFLEYPSQDMFALVMAHAFLAHAWNADRSIRLEDWFKELVWGETSITCTKDLNKFVWEVFEKRRNFVLRADTDDIRKYVRRLCAAPNMGQIAENPTHS